ncbi:MAG: hypothetical protein WCH84_02525 [Verrucomicrobiota bacterium]
MNAKAVYQTTRLATIGIVALMLTACGKDQKTPLSTETNTPAKQASPFSKQPVSAESAPSGKQMQTNSTTKASESAGEITGVIAIDLDATGKTKQSGSNYCETAEIGSSGFILKVISNGRSDFLKDCLPRVTTHPITRNNYTLQVTLPISAVVDLSRGYGAAVCYPECELVDNNTKSVIKKAAFEKLMLGGTGFNRVVSDVLAMLDEVSKASSAPKTGESSTASDVPAGTDALGYVADLCKAGEMQKAVTYSREKTQSSPHDVNNWLAYGTALAADGQFAEAAKAMSKSAEVMRRSNPTMGGMPVKGLDEAFEGRALVFQGMAENIAEAPSQEIGNLVRKGCVYLESCISNKKEAQKSFEEALRLAKSGGHEAYASFCQGVLNTLPMRAE